jgi:ATP-binding cassette subfamily G (WHITE) protein 2 (SNQ2)
MAATPADAFTLEKSRTSSTREQPLDSVDVVKAEEQFNELARELSRKSNKRDSRDSNSGSSSTVQGKDIEKGAGPEDAFDLREYLTSSNDANQAAGIKHKHVCRFYF